MIGLKGCLFGILKKWVRVLIEWFIRFKSWYEIIGGKIIWGSFGSVKGRLEEGWIMNKKKEEENIFIVNMRFTPMGMKSVYIGILDFWAKEPYTMKPI